jgi:predicted CXXCH cytochrome family protein
VLVIGLGTLAAVADGVRIERSLRTQRAIASVAAHVPREGRRDRWVGSAGCRPCHADEHASWHATYHRTMTQPASAQSILGDLSSFPDGSAARASIVMVTGSHHMQVYWTDPRGDGVLEALPWAWLIPERAWVPNEATLLRPGDDAPTYTWNRVCIACHAVAGVPGQHGQTVDTRVAELGIACEACHGPGRAHVERHANPVARWTARIDDAGDPTIVHPAKLPADASSQVCGACHGITLLQDEPAWLRRGHAAAPPDPIASWGALVRHPLRADTPGLDAVLEANADYLVERFWSDGMVRVSGREYGGLVESPCHAGGDFGCLSCHAMHAGEPDDQLSPDRDGDAMCAPCHTAIAGDPAAHSRHAADIQCIDCHMPHTTYGLLKAIRSHEISSPSVAVAIETGRIDACSGCHLDRPLDWTAHQLHETWGQPAVDAAAADGTRAAAVVQLVRGDAGQRALAAWHMAWPPALQASGRGWQAPLLARLLDDPYAAVRIVAARSLATLGYAVDVAEIASERRPSTVSAIDARWRATPGAIDRVGDAVLSTAAGELDVAAIDELLSRRDDRRVSLEE